MSSGDVKNAVSGGNVKTVSLPLNIACTILSYDLWETHHFRGLTGTSIGRDQTILGIIDMYVPADAIETELREQFAELSLKGS